MKAIKLNLKPKCNNKVDFNGFKKIKLDYTPNCDGEEWNVIVLAGLNLIKSFNVTMKNWMKLHSFKRIQLVKSG